MYKIITKILYLILIVQGFNEFHALEEPARYKNKKLPAVTKIVTTLVPHASLETPLPIYKELQETIRDDYITSELFNPHWCNDHFRTMQGAERAIAIPRIFNHENLPLTLPQYNTLVEHEIQELMKEYCQKPDPAKDIALELLYHRHIIKYGFQIFSDGSAERPFQATLFSQCTRPCGTTYSHIVYTFVKNMLLLDRRIYDTDDIIDLLTSPINSLNPLKTVPNAPVQNKTIQKCFLQEIAQIQTSDKTPTSNDLLTKAFRHEAVATLIRQLHGALNIRFSHDLMHIFSAQGALKDVSHTYDINKIIPAIERLEQARDAYLYKLARVYMNRFNVSDAEVTA